MCCLRDYVVPQCNNILSVICNAVFNFCHLCYIRHDQYKIWTRSVKSRFYVNLMCTI